MLEKQYVCAGEYQKLAMCMNAVNESSEKYIQMKRKLGEKLRFNKQTFLIVFFLGYTGQMTNSEESNDHDDRGDFLIQLIFNEVVRFEFFEKEFFVFSFHRIIYSNVLIFDFIQKNFILMLIKMVFYQSLFLMVIYRVHHCMICYKTLR